MAAYAALTSLMQIIDQLQHHPFPPISLDKQQAESLTAIVIFLQEFPFGYSDQADPLEIRIARAAYAAEDVIESYIVDVINKNGVSISNDGGEISCSVLYEDLHQVIEKIDMIKKEVMGLTTEKTVVQAQQINFSALLVHQDHLPRYLAVGVRHNSHYFSSSLHLLLWNLQTLIICHSGFGPVTLEIWNMPKHRHVEFHKGEMSLQGIGLDRNVMENLQTLKGVCGLSLRYILPALFSIKKLGVADGIIPNLQLSIKLESFRCWNLHRCSNNADRSTLSQEVEFGIIRLPLESGEEDACNHSALIPLLQKLN